MIYGVRDIVVCVKECRGPIVWMHHKDAKAEGDIKLCISSHT
jgi:hypothetical protein